MTSGSFL